MTERGTYLPLTWNRDTGELGVHLPEELPVELCETTESEDQTPKLAHPLYIVETVSTFRMRYVVSCKSAEHAQDTVTMNEASEMSQQHLGEQIVSTREISQAEFLKIHDADNDYLQSWDTATKYKNSVHVVDYSKE
jgi:hypothetical protein